MKALLNAVAVVSLFFAGVASAQIRSENPMSHAGQKHNELLACLLEVDPALSRDPFEVLVTDCGVDPGMPVEEFIARYSAMVPSDLLAPIEKQTWRRERFSDAQFAYMLRVESILQTQSPEEAAVSLEQLEREAIQTLGREEADLAVLAGLSTARYSLYYWTIVNPGEGLHAMKAKWWHIVLADVGAGLVDPILGAVCSRLVAAL